MIQHCTSIISGEEARSGLLKGIKTLAGIVATTFGPRGHTVILVNDGPTGTARITKDGVSVARAVNLPGIEGVGAEFAKDASLRTNTLVGDGTTTSLILSSKLIHELSKYISTGMSRVHLLQALEAAGADCLQMLRDLSRPVKTDRMLFDIATIAANNDRSMGRVIADAFAAVGKEGTITVEDGYADTDKIDLASGCTISNGFLSPYFALNNAHQVELDNPLVLITDQVLSSAVPLIPTLERCVKEKRALLVIAPDVTGDALSTLAINAIRGTVRCCAVRAPGYGDLKKSTLEDLATIAGITTYVSDELQAASATTPSSVACANVGSCRRVVVSPTRTVMYFDETSKNSQRIRDRVVHLRSLLQQKDITSYQRSKLNERIGRLLGKVCTIRVGARTEVEADEKKDRYIDALSTARAALESGFLPGGGAALLRAAQALERKLGEGQITDLVSIAAHRALIATLHEPLHLLAASADISGPVAAEAIKASEDTFYGLDALRRQYGDMSKAGVLDATSVVTTALESALGVSSVFFNTDSVVQPVPTPVQTDTVAK